MDAFCEAYKLGHNIEACAIVAGIERNTVMLWWTRGERGEEPYAEFVRRSMLARKLAALNASTRAFNDKPAWWLERVEHQDFGRRDRVEHDHRSGGLSLAEAVRQAQLAKGYDPDDPRDVIILPKRTNGTSGGGNGTGTGGEI